MPRQHTLRQTIADLSKCSTAELCRGWTPRCALHWSGGTIIDGISGDTAGSKIGEAVYEGGNAIAKTAAKVVKGAVEAVKSTAIGL